MSRSTALRPDNAFSFVKSDLTGPESEVRRGDALDSRLNMPTGEIQNLILERSMSPVELADAVARRMRSNPSKGKLSMLRNGVAVLTVIPIHANTPVAAFAVAEIVHADATNSVIAANVGAVKTEQRAPGTVIKDQRVEELTRALKEYKDLERELPKDMAAQPEDKGLPLAAAVVYLSMVNVRRISVQLSEYQEQKIPPREDYERYYSESTEKFGPKFGELVDWLQKFGTRLQDEYGSAKAVAIGIVGTKEEHARQKEDVELRRRLLTGV